MLDDPRMTALAPEGEMMVRALVDDLAAISGVEVTVMRDFRVKADLPARMRVVHPGQFNAVFRQAILESDAVWPIAPEQDDLLLRVTGEILARGRRLLGSRPDAVSIATSKRATAVALALAGVPVAPVYSSERELPSNVHEVVVKPDDGAGCQDTLLFHDRARLREWLRGRLDSTRIFQPYIRGEACSLSMLCCEGRARLLACNRQKVNLENGEFRFDGVSVNALADDDGRYAALADDIARALPGLWGCCGVDFIETGNGPIVIEVNPRLTTSYAGLYRATGSNPAQLVLELPGSLEATKGLPRTAAIEVEVHAG